mgnify:CR=1 FL=1
MKNFLVVVDMQKDFVDGALGTKEAVAIVENVKKKIAEYQANGDEIIFTRDTHDENYLESLEGKYIPFPHCIKGTSGWEIIDGLTDPADDILDKLTFGSTELPAFIKIKAGMTPIEEIHIIGVCTDVCVISNAMLIKAFDTEVLVQVDSTCCAGVTPESHQNALKAMKQCQIEIL